LIDYLIFGFVDNAVMLAGSFYGLSIENKFPKKYQTGFMGATVGAGIGNSFSDTLGGFASLNTPLAIGSGLGCLIALALIPLYLKFKKN